MVKSMNRSIDRFNNQIINYPAPWKIQFANRWLFCVRLFFYRCICDCCCCCRWQIESRCLCSALNSSSCYKIANKTTKSIIFYRLTWTFDVAVFVWLTFTNTRDEKKDAKAQRPNSIRWVNDWSACRLCGHICSRMRTAISMHFIWNYDRLGKEGVICIIIYVIKYAKLCALEPNYYFQQLVDSQAWFISVISVTMHFTLSPRIK